MKGNVIYFDKITDSDLRRALLFFLMGFMLVLFDLYFLISDFITGFAADPTTADPEFTPDWIMNGLLITSVPTMVLSQIWYLRTKHILGESRRCLKNGEYWEFIKRTHLEVLILFMIMLAPVSFILSELSSTLIIPFLVVYFILIILEFSSPLYLLMILSWNFKRLLDRGHPGMKRNLQVSLSSFLGLTAAIVFVFALALTISLILESL